MRLGPETLRVGSDGTLNALEVAKRYNAGFLQASTSECYGDALEHPQRESYWGNVNLIGLRSVYDEAKRFSEATVMAYHRYYKVRTGLVRIFNMYGPRLQPNDGREISNLMMQALSGEALTILCWFCLVAEHGVIAKLRNRCPSDVTGNRRANPLISPCSAQMKRQKRITKIAKARTP